MAKRVVIFGTCGADIDTRALEAVVRFVSATQPDQVVCTERSIPLLQGLRDVYDRPLSFHWSATDKSFDAVLDRLDARLLPEHYPLAPGWTTTEKQDACQQSRIAGNTALNTAKALNTSVALGYTGRLGIGSQTWGFSCEAVKAVTGLEVGNLMDMKALRFRIRVGNPAGPTLAVTLRDMRLQQGFGMLVIGQDCDCHCTNITPCHNRAEDGQHVRPVCVPIHKGRFTVDGRTWEV